MTAKLQKDNKNIDATITMAPINASGILIFEYIMVKIGDEYLSGDNKFSVYSVI